MTMSEERSLPLFTFLLSSLPPRLLQEHRKGGREVIDCTAANK